MFDYDRMSNEQLAALWLKRKNLTMFELVLQDRFLRMLDALGDGEVSSISHALETMTKRPCTQNQKSAH